MIICTFELTELLLLQLLFIFQKNFHIKVHFQGLTSDLKNKLRLFS